MGGSTTRRRIESSAIIRLLNSAAVEPAGLLIDGERGIGKTTLWLDGVEQARRRGWTVLETRPAESESTLAYSSLADLLGGLSEEALSHLPEPQRLATDRVLLRGDTGDAPTDPRAVAAAFLSAVNALAEAGPALIAIDDLQWLDGSTAAAVAYAARRLSGPVGVLATARVDPGEQPATEWLTLPRPDSLDRVTLGPLSLGALHEVLTARLGRSFSRQAMARIGQVSAGNPFYALELARAMEHLRDPTSLPATLSALVRNRLSSLHPDAAEMLLAAACTSAPTVDLIARATHTSSKRVVEVLSDAEKAGIVGYDDHRLRFGHPLLAAGVYADASPAARRAMHARLAGAVTEPELRARHLAKSVVIGDPAIWRSLDGAATSAAARGAPGAAAELLDLAIALGGDTEQRRVRAAEHHLRAANFAEASARLEKIAATSAPGPALATALQLLAEVRVAEDDYTETDALLERALDNTDDPRRRAQILVLLSFVRVGKLDFDGAERSLASGIDLATQLDDTDLLSQALGFREMVRFISGHGFDTVAMSTALDLEDPATDGPIAVRASVQNALLLAWTGRLRDGYAAMLAIRRRCVDLGEEHELMTIDFHCVWLAIWQGNFSEAELLADDALERARTLGRHHSIFAALTMQAAVLAHGGREAQARQAIDEALQSAHRYGAPVTTRWTVSILGFLEVSLGNYAAALQSLDSLLNLIDAAPVALEIEVGLFVPDLVEALIASGSLGEAERLLTRFDSDGQRLDRPWILATAARCRAMLVAARGDFGAASAAATQAMAEHARLPMPFERARTQLFIGQLERRQRRNRAAEANLSSALQIFEDLGTPIWADRARAELGRANIGPRPDSLLTRSERRVADLAASGMTNREIAAALFISPKTVESNLARIYRKLGIRSRAELGLRLNVTDP
ncbi:LuxR C-terminal-related transcriptional regulator [Mycolicibacterium sp. BiH015]|uniref:AAA family ATPase n=1 Tax=Mycolicibacterium sp. BiH015 TaxID=3018808 RepID=UPI0022E218CF|nr:LuxR family transcriptional regulator [Mycolicibacterium sp. BiH015]MDA2891548.1 LuxR C-terminal-related transcriptional regulator [Mycolicibacterium sp. BiH015]